MRWVTCLRQSYAILALIISVSLPQVGKAQTSENVLIDVLLSNPSLFLTSGRFDYLSTPELRDLIAEAAEAATPEQLLTLVKVANEETLGPIKVTVVEEALSKAAVDNAELGRKILNAAKTTDNRNLLGAINRAKEENRVLTFSDYSAPNTPTGSLEETFIGSTASSLPSLLPPETPRLGGIPLTMLLEETPLPSSIREARKTVVDPNEYEEGVSLIPNGTSPYFVPSSTQTYYNYERNRFTSLGGGGETPMSPVQ